MKYTITWIEPKTPDQLTDKDNVVGCWLGDVADVERTASFEADTVDELKTEAQKIIELESVNIFTIKDESGKEILTEEDW